MRVSTRWAPPPGFGGMLWAARVRTGLSACATGRLAGISDTHVHDLEAGARRPSVTVAERLAVVLDLDLWEAAVLGALAVDDAELHSRRPVNR